MQVEDEVVSVCVLKDQGPGPVRKQMTESGAQRGNFTGEGVGGRARRQRAGVEHSEKGERGISHGEEAEGTGGEEARQRRSVGGRGVGKEQQAGREHVEGRQKEGGTQ